MTTRPRGKPHAYLDSDGYVYSTKPASGMPTIIFICIGFALLGALAMMNRFHIPFEALRQPLPTAAVQDRTPLPAAPTMPAPPRDTGRSEAPAAATDYEEAIKAYNEEQQARAAEFATAETPAASEAEINAWLEAPPSTSTPLPEPGQPGFAASFEEAPTCSPFIGYLPGDPCIEILNQQAGE
jgi:hypothetical protein